MNRRLAKGIGRKTSFDEVDRDTPLHGRSVMREANTRSPLSQRYLEEDEFARMCIIYIHIHHHILNIFRCFLRDVGAIESSSID